MKSEIRKNPDKNAAQNSDKIPDKNKDKKPVRKDTGISTGGLGSRNSGDSGEDEATLYVDGIPLGIRDTDYIKRFLYNKIPNVKHVRVPMNREIGRDPHTRIVKCPKLRTAPEPIKTEQYRTNSYRSVRESSGAWIPGIRNDKRQCFRSTVIQSQR